MNKSKTRKSSSKKNAGMYQLKITLSDTEPPVWRRLLVRGDVNLGLLHSIIQVCMGWTNSHLHEFVLGNKRYSDPKFEMDGDCGGDRVHDEWKTALMEVATREKSKFIYEYDFGDSWEHVILVEKILEPDASSECAMKCMAGERACPPEDCGGVWGYAELLEIIKNPKRKDHEEMMDWLGGEFDPEAFNIEHVNIYLQKLKWPRTTIDQLAKVLMARDGNK